MALAVARPKPPSEDQRWKLVDATMRRLGYEPHALIEALHVVQESFGYLEPASIRFVAQSLQVPVSQAFGVATFYHHFTMRPPGKHTCVVCMGTACYIKGGQAVLNEIEKLAGVTAGHTTKDGQLSVLTARCLGSCGRAPAIVVDGDTLGKQTPEMALEKIRGLLHP